MSVNLWTPDGIVREKDVITVTDPMERVTMGRLHTIAQRHGFALVCQKCDTALRGQNVDTPGSVAVIACQCREFRYVR